MSGRWCVLLTVNHNSLELLTDLPTFCPLTYLHWAYFTHTAIAAAVSKRKPSEQKHKVSPCPTHTQIHTRVLHSKGDRCSVLKQLQGSTAITRRWARAEPFQQHAGAGTPPCHSTHPTLTWPWVPSLGIVELWPSFLKCTDCNFLLILPPPTQFGLAILRQLGFTYRGNTNSFPAK